MYDSAIECALVDSVGSRCSKRACALDPTPRRTGTTKIDNYVNLFFGSVNGPCAARGWSSAQARLPRMFT